MASTSKSICQKIAIVGTSGSGKTTLAIEISHQLKILHVELDALYWEPNWQEVAAEIFQARVSAALQPTNWVVDGNYNKVRDLIWHQANTVVFLDYSFRTTFSRLLSRTIRRAYQKEELWSGNRESLKQSFFSTDSILLWAIKTYPQRRKQYPQLFQQPQYAHLSIVHLKSPAEAKAWLQSL